MALKLSKKRKIELWEACNRRCYYCGEILDPGLPEYIQYPFMQIDHVIPQSKGGIDLIENYVPICRLCNCTKGNRPVETFRPTLFCNKRFKDAPVNFNIDQVEWLKSQGFDLGVVVGEFYGETIGMVKLISTAKEIAKDKKDKQKLADHEYKYRNGLL